MAECITELQNRGVEDILIACVDGLKGFPDAINTVYPETHIQLCIVHMIRNSLRFVSWKDYKAVTADLKRIYQADTEDIALMERDGFSERWDDKYPQISKSWIRNWENLNTFFRYPKDIRKRFTQRTPLNHLTALYVKKSRIGRYFQAMIQLKK